ncbi:MAG: Gfo/Idh/MocA family oxidoreductase [candidate division Zixibacteria bacterium]|nr:Gfo/Idh/MocA family oxidoreductase [candidate division Zixibacteria bacterium]
MTAPLTIGVIGVGHLGSHHVRILAALDLWQLAGVFDVDARKNATVAAQYNLSTCGSIDELIERVQAVVICTPTESHAPLARRAIAQGRHVLVEKPLCSSDVEAGELIALARHSGVTAAVGHVERFNPALAVIRGHLGSPRFIEAHRLNQFSPRGLATDVILEMMIHDIDIVRDLVGAEPVEIRAAGVPVLSETDDIANCRLAFPDGCIANLTASRISATPMRKLRIFSADHYTVVDLAEKSAESYRLFGSAALPPAEGYRTLTQWQGKAIAHQAFAVPQVNALEAELRDFHAAILERRPPRVDFAEGARSLRLALAIAAACKESARAARNPERSHSHSTTVTA